MVSYLILLLCGQVMRCSDISPESTVITLADWYVRLARENYVWILNGC